MATRCSTDKGAVCLHVSLRMWHFLLQRPAVIATHLLSEQRFSQFGHACSRDTIRWSVHTYYFADCNSHSVPWLGDLIHTTQVFEMLQSPVSVLWAPDVAKIFHKCICTKNTTHGDKGLMKSLGHHCIHGIICTSSYSVIPKMHHLSLHYVPPNFPPYRKTKCSV